MTALGSLGQFASPVVLNAVGTMLQNNTERTRFGVSAAAMCLAAVLAIVAFSVSRMSRKSVGAEKKL
jgi:predicted permease